MIALFYMTSSDFVDIVDILFSKLIKLMVLKLLLQKKKYFVLCQVMILQAPRDESWESFVDSLPAYEPRFIVYDFEFTDSEKRIHADLLFITW